MNSYRKCDQSGCKVSASVRGPACKVPNTSECYVIVIFPFMFQSFQSAFVDMFFVLRIGFVWDMTLCYLVSTFKYFKGSLCLLRLHDAEDEGMIVPQSIRNCSHSVTFQKT